VASLGPLNGPLIAVVSVGSDPWTVSHAIATFRARHPDVLTLALVRGASVKVRIMALNAGADDVLSHPFVFEELAARLRAMAKRVNATRFRVGDLTMDLASRAVERGGRSVRLTKKEFQLLEHLMRHCGEIVPRDTLEAIACRNLEASLAPNNIVHTHMGRIRKKLEAGGLSALIHTVQGVGYVCAETRPAAAREHRAVRRS
jgi:DNA-binding response OmpR family regulator